MDRQQCIKFLQEASPVIYNITYSDDMGYEFTGLTVDGVIFPEPGMLVSTSSGGALPPHLFEDDVSDDEIMKFLNECDVTPYEDLSKNILNEVIEEYRLHIEDQA